MRRLLLALALGLLLGTTAGCIIPAYSADPVRRTQQLIFTSENLRLVLDEWERLWMLDQPDHMTPYRTHASRTSAGILRSSDRGTCTGWRSMRPSTISIWGG